MVLHGLWNRFNWAKAGKWTSDLHLIWNGYSSFIHTLYDGTKIESSYPEVNEAVLTTRAGLWTAAGAYTVIGMIFLTYQLLTPQVTPTAEPSRMSITTTDEYRIYQLERDMREAKQDLRTASDRLLNIESDMKWAIRGILAMLALLLPISAAAISQILRLRRVAEHAAALSDIGP